MLSVSLSQKKQIKSSGKCFGILSCSWLKNSLAWKNSFGKEDPTLDGFCALSVLVAAKKTPEANSASEPVSMQFLMLHAVLPHGLSMSHLSFKSRWSPTSFGAASPLPRPAWAPSSERCSSHFLSDSHRFHHVRSGLAIHFSVWLALTPDVPWTMGTLCSKSSTGFIDACCWWDNHSCHHTWIACPPRPWVSPWHCGIYQLPQGCCCGHGGNNVRTVF